MHCELCAVHCVLCAVCCVLTVMHRIISPNVQLAIFGINPRIEFAALHVPERRLADITRLRKTFLTLQLVSRTVTLPRCSIFYISCGPRCSIFPRVTVADRCSDVLVMPHRNHMSWSIRTIPTTVPNVHRPHITFPPHARIPRGNTTEINYVM